MEVIDWMVNRSALVQKLRWELDEVKRQRDLLLERARGEVSGRVVDPPTVRDDGGPRCRRCRGTGIVLHWNGLGSPGCECECPECGGVAMSAAERERMVAQCARIEELVMRREHQGAGRRVA